MALFPVLRIQSTLLCLTQLSDEEGPINLFGGLSQHKSLLVKIAPVGFRGRRKHSPKHYCEDKLLQKRCAVLEMQDHSIQLTNQICYKDRPSKK